MVASHSLPDFDRLGFLSIPDASIDLVATGKGAARVDAAIALLLNLAEMSTGYGV